MLLAYILFGWFSFANQSLKSFVSDGCTLSPDSYALNSITHCCVEHDLHYFVGGLPHLKTKADKNLARCIHREVRPGNEALGKIYEFASDLGGRPRFGTFKNPFEWRWGYGWDDFNYRPLTALEIDSAIAELREVRETLWIHERALNETGQDSWRFNGLRLSPRQFKFIEQVIDQKLEELLIQSAEM